MAVSIVGRSQMGEICNAVNGTGGKMEVPQPSSSDAITVPWMGSGD